MNRDLKNRFDAFKSDSSSSELDWQNIGPKIQQGIAEKKKKKRRAIIWWFFGVGMLLGIIMNQDFFTSAEGNAKSTEKLESNAMIDPMQSTVSDEDLKIVNRAESNKQEKNEDEKASLINPSINSQASAAEKLNKSNSDLQRSAKQSSNVRANRLLLEKSTEVETEFTVVSIEAPLEMKPFTLDEQIIAFPALPSILYPAVESVTGSESLPIPSLKVPAENSEFDPTLFQELEHRPWSLDFAIGMNVSSIAEEMINSTNKVGSHFAMHVEYSTALGFIMGTGFNYDNVRFQSTFLQMDTTLLYRPNTIDTIFRFKDNFEFYTYKDSINGIRVTDFGHTNQVRNYSIPLFIGYDWKINRLRIGVRAGVNFQFRQQLVGRLLNEALEITDVNETFTQSSIHHYLRLQIGYQLSDRWSIWSHIRRNGQSQFENPVNSIEIGQQAILSGSIGVRVRL